MAYKFVEKQKTAQEEIAYIVYMIVGSYFNRAICNNQVLADRLYLYYKEMGETKQEAKEQMIIAQAEHLFKSYEEALETMNCEVVISFREGCYILDFVTGFVNVRAEVNRKGACEMQLLAG